MYKLIILMLLAFSFQTCQYHVLGKLTSADVYFSVPIKSESHDYATFISLQSNLPAGLVTNDGNYIYLDIKSQLLAQYATEELKVKGEKTPNSNFIQPTKIWVKKGNKWLLVFSN